MERNARTRWWFVQGLTVLGLALVFGFFFMAWMPARRDYLTQRNFRQLADMGDQVQEALANLHTSLTNAARDAVAQGLWGSRFVQHEAAGARVQEWARPEDQVVGTNLANARRVFADSVRVIEPKVELTSGITSNAVQAGAVLVGPQISPSRGLRNYWLDLTYQLKEQADATPAFQVRTDLGVFMQPVLARSEFDDVLIVNANGDVVFQAAEAGQRITNLSATAELRLTRVPDFAAASRAEERLMGSNVIAGVTTLAELQLADGACKVFVQPLTFSLAPGRDRGETTQWHLCGLVRTHVFQERAMALPPTAIILFFFGALACLLAWPFLNLAFAGARNAPGRGAAFAVGLASFFACAGLAFLILDTGGYTQMEEVMDGQVERLAATLTDNLHGELAAVHRQLSRCSEALTAAAQCAALDETGSTNDVSLRAWPQLPLEEMPDYPWLRQVFWGGRNGRQTHKWTPALKTTPFLSLASRPYFMNLVEQRAWPVQCPASNTFPIHSDFYLEPLFSRNRGENVVVLAEPFTDFAAEWPTNTEAGGDAGVLANRPIVSCIEFRSLALIEPIVPASYGFCVVDATGLVLFHSDERRNLRENFLKECGRRPRLLGALQGRTTDSFDVRYLNRIHHVRVAPLACLPWSLIVFRDTQALGSSRRAMLSGAGALFCLYAVWLLVLLAVRALVAKVWRGLTGRPAVGALTWLWPDPARARSYLGLTVWLLVITAGYMALMWGTTDPKSIIAASLILPLLVLGPVVALLWVWRKPSDFKIPWHERPWASFLRRASFPAFLAVTLVVLAMLPALGSFHLASQIETAALLRSGQLELARDLRDRQSRIRRELRLLPEATSATLLPRRLAETLDRCDTAFFTTQTSSTAPLTASRITSDKFERLYRTLRLSVDDFAIKTGGLLPARASDGSWQSRVQDGQLVTEVAGTNPLGQPGPLRIATTLPTFRWPEPRGMDGLWYALLLFAAVAPFIIAGFVARQIFLWGLRPFRSEGGPRARAPDPASAVPAKSLPRPIRTATRSFVVRERLHVQVIDLARAEDRVWLVPGRTPTLEHGGVVVLAHTGCAEHAEESVKMLRAELKRDLARTVLVLDDEVTPVAPASPAAEPTAAPLFPKDSTAPEDLSAQAVREVCQDHERRWNECLPEEKWVLHHVARTGLVAAGAPEIQTLLAKGVVRLDPRLRLHSGSFRRFVLARFPADVEAFKLSDGEADPASARWQAWKGALGVGLTAVALFLFMTQRELWQLVVGLATTFIAGFGQFNKITGFFGRQKKTEDED